MTKERFIVFDMSNMLHRTFFVHKNEDDDTIAGLASHTALTTLNKYFKEFTPTKTIMAFDRSSWRKEYTKSDLCLSGRIYKGERRKNMTERQQQKLAIFMNHIKDFEDMMREHTSVVCLAAEQLEADDLIAGVAQKYGDEHEVIIVSADRDFLQLLRHPGVTLIDPNSGKPRDLKEWNNDPDYFIFEKCFRGETGPSSDNIQSAFPKIRSTKIKQAYEDPYFLESLKVETWQNEKKQKMVVGELLEENRLLMDLSEQPPAIRKLIDETIEHEFANPGKYSFFHFMKFCGKYKLKKISEHAENFTRMLSR